MPTTNMKAAINLRLAMVDQPLVPYEKSEAALVAPMIARQREMNRRLEGMLCPADQRIQNFLDSYLADCSVHPQLPRVTMTLDQPGIARELSLPHDGDEFHSDNVESYRLYNGVLHNPKNDRRTTAGVFHIADGGLAIPDDKVATTRDVFARLLEKAFQAPYEDQILPYTANEPRPAATYVSLYLRPIVMPAVPGVSREQSMETRLIFPGGMVANIDFVEGIFGNAGDPDLPENDAALDADGWTGTTGLVVLAPHLTKLTKKELGLPHIDDATDRQKRDGQCYSDENELYNNGKAFKVCIRDERGVIATILADNYFGYCKKEVKTQIGYSANLVGCAEEEHSGGARVYPTYNLGQEFHDNLTPEGFDLKDIISRDPKRFELQADGWAKDNAHPEFVLVPARSSFSLRDQKITWTDTNGATKTLHLSADKVYFLPDGYRVYTKARSVDSRQWQLFGISPYSTTCHKPATVSGGGKSEISKSLLDAFVSGTAYTSDFEQDMDTVAKLLEHDYSNRFRDPQRNGVDHRAILSAERSLGSVIKLLTPSTDYSDEYNEFLASIPNHIEELTYNVKRYYKPEWGENWREHFSVGVINGRNGNALRLDGERVLINMLRVGFETDGSWRLFSLRPDFSPATKVQTEDDITASTVAPIYEAPNPRLGNDAGLPRKFVLNCEQLLFQRPDDAKVRGYDKQAEYDLAQPGTYISNFEALTQQDAKDIVETPQVFSEYTKPQRRLIRKVAEAAPGEVASFWTVSDRNRVNSDGKRSTNPRYLQQRPDIAHPLETQAADLTDHLVRKLPSDQFAPLPVEVVAAGRRNNAASPGVPPLCVYNPLHYMQLPELFMEFISSMTGKSPSTTGAGSEGALTKAPFNALPAVFDLNASLLSFALTGYDGWLSSAGTIGPNVEVAHDISMLVPELFSRMSPEERDAEKLVADGFLDKLDDFEHNGKQVLASRLGYRINKHFLSRYFGRIFLHPDMVFTDEMLKPELQDMDIFAESMDVIVTTHKVVAQKYFNDGTIEFACPPVKGLLEIMANGQTAEGWTLSSPEFRALFERENILASDWYLARLHSKQQYMINKVEASLNVAKAFQAEAHNGSAADRIGLNDRIADLEKQLAHVQSDDYLQHLKGTTGREVRFS